MCSYVLLYVAMCGKVWLSAGQGAPGVGTGVAMCSHAHLMHTALKRRSMRNALVPGRRPRKFPARKFN